VQSADTIPIQPPTVQAVSDAEALPELPTILKNIAPLQPLAVSKPLVQQSDFSLGATSAKDFGGQPTPLQTKTQTVSGHSSKDNFLVSPLPTVQVPPVPLDNEPFVFQRFAQDADQAGTLASNQATRPSESSIATQGIPSSRPIITELVGNNSTESTSDWGWETPMQRKSASSTEENLRVLEELSSFGTISEYSSSSDLTSALAFKDTAANGTPVHSREQKSVSEEASSVDNLAKEKNSQSVANSAKQEESQEENFSNDLEFLAREIYSLIRQRLAIERERQGHYSCTRLPW
jgi:hypothetical protein